MSAELFGYIVKRNKDGQLEDVPLYKKNKTEVVDINIGNASAFRDSFDDFIANAAFSEMEKQDDEDEPMFYDNKWDKTYYISVDRMKVMKYRLKEEKVDAYKIDHTDDIYDLSTDEITYYMLDKFLDQIGYYIEFADPFSYGDEYYFKFYISY